MTDKEKKILESACNREAIYGLTTENYKLARELEGKGLLKEERHLGSPYHTNFLLTPTGKELLKVILES